MKFPKGFRDKISLTNELFTFAGNIGAGIGALLAFLGITSNFANSSMSLAPNVDVSTLSLPVRMTLLLLISAALGWGLGALVARFSKSSNEVLGFAIYVIALLWGGLLVGAAEWLATHPVRQVLPETLLFTTIGTGVAFWVSTFHFRSTGGGAKFAMRMRCDALMVFSVGCALFLALTLLGAQA